MISDSLGVQIFGTIEDCGWRLALSYGYNRAYLLSQLFANNSINNIRAYWRRVAQFIHENCLEARGISSAPKRRRKSSEKPSRSEAPRKTTKSRNLKPRARTRASKSQRK
jgi:hypothetical protein